jgi:tetratricopeptide (TPR) repeat protein
LHWMVSSRNVPLVNAFIKVKEMVDQGDGDWFIQLAIDFHDKLSFAADLVEELNRLMEEGLKGADGDVPSDAWKKIELSEAQSGFQALFLSCDQLLRLCGRNIDNLTLVISPTAVKNPKEYTQWWELACKICRDYKDWHPKLRMLVLDGAEKPFLLQTFADNTDVALSQIPPLDMNGAVRAVAEEANDGSDSGRFRLHLVDMNNAIGEQDKKKLEDASAAALSIAEANQWLDMWTTVLMTRGGGWLSFKNYEQAVKDYRQAQVVAARGMEAQVPGCDKLLMQAMLFEGTAYFMAEYLEHAARAYQNAALKAQELKDNWIGLEGWRMASLSMERHKKSDLAWQYATQALAVGRDMKPEEREQSTLAFVGQAMLRISPNGHVKSEVKNVFDQMLGEEWLEQVESVTA